MSEAENSKVPNTISLYSLFAQKIESMGRDRKRLNKNERIEGYNLLTGIFKELPDISTKGNTKLQLQQLGKLESLCNKFYDEIEAHGPLRELTKVVIGLGINRIKRFASSGFYQEVDISRITDQVSNYMVIKLCSCKDKWLEK